jgi:phosphinothricin acetyltransferase
MHDLTIRPAAEGDASAIAAIYNHYVRTSTATFDTLERSLPEQVAWIGQHADPFPALVAENSDGVIAWGALSPWGTRCAYRHTVEISVYVAPEAAGNGVGPALTEVLVGRARDLHHHAIVSQIVHENDASLSMSRRLGFEHVGTLKEVGRKFDRWLDVVLMELVLDTEAESDSVAEVAE